MIVEDFRKIIADFRDGPIPGKHAYVWTGDIDSLVEITGRTIAKELDLSSDLNINVSDEEADEKVVGRTIEKALEKRLFELYSEANKQGKPKLLIVKSSSILARYRIGLAAFYSYFLGDNTKVVLMAPRPQASLNLPEYVKYDAEEVAKYLGNQVSEENIVE